MNITHLYADGGVIGKNPSAVGGTWAWIAVDERDQMVTSDSSNITPHQAQVSEVTNNVSELCAILFGLTHMPTSWAGTVCSDSMVSLGRVFEGWKWNNVPGFLHQRYQLERARLVNWAQIRHVLLDGHPTRAQLAAGVGKRGHPVSRWNVECDRMCALAGERYLKLRSVKASIGNETLRPAVGEELMGEGMVIQHEKIVDSAGKFHGLIRLTVAKPGGSAPNVDAWKTVLLDGAIVYAAGADLVTPQNLVILYKLPALAV